MSVSTLFSFGTEIIDEKFLPQTHGITPPTFAQILTTSNDAGSNSIVNLSGVTLNDNYLTLNNTSSSNLGQLHINNSNVSWQVFIDSNNNLLNAAYLPNNQHLNILTLNPTTGATIIGDPKLLGSQLYVNGTQGLSKVYDTIYNPVIIPSGSSTVTQSMVYHQNYNISYGSNVNLVPFVNTVDGESYVTIYTFSNLSSYPNCCNFNLTIANIQLIPYNYPTNTTISIAFYLLDVANLTNISQTDLQKSSFYSENISANSPMTFGGGTVTWSFSSAPSSLKLVARISNIQGGTGTSVFKSVIAFEFTGNTIGNTYLPTQTV